MRDGGRPRGPPRSRRPRARVAPSRSASSSRPNRRGRVSTTPRAGWSDFADAVRREVEITFNPRTRGAKIAGRCPDTQERPTEVSRAEEARQFEDVDAGFDLQSFTAQLEAQLEAQNAAASTIDAAEEKVNAELVQRLAEVADGYSAAGAAGELAAIDPDAAPVAVGELAKSERRDGTRARLLRRRLRRRGLSPAANSHSCATASTVSTTTWR